MDAVFDSLSGILAVVFIFGLPVIVVVMVYLNKMIRGKREKEIRQLIIENHTDPETAKLLVEEPKKAKQERRQMGPVNLDTLRTACTLLGVGLGSFIYWSLKQLGFGDMGTIELGLLIAFGIGVGLLCSFLAEMELYKKYGKDKSAEPTESKEEK